MKTAAALITLLTALPAFTLAFAPAPFHRPGKISRVEVGKDVTLEIETGKHPRRRVLVATTVCLREAKLEHLMTRNGAKGYESILDTRADAREIHAALLLAGAIPGSPARFGARFTPATGTLIRITLEWKEKGEFRRANAGEWVREIKTKKAMPHDWVFAGSLFLDDPDPRVRPRYLANDGDVIVVANFESAMLDLPVRSSTSGDELLHEANTEAIPPVGTPVTLVLTPLAGGKD